MSNPQQTTHAQSKTSLILTLAALTLTFPQLVSASYELVLPPNSPWKEDIAALVAKAMADHKAKQAALVASVTPSGFAVARKTAVRVAVASAAATSSAAASAATAVGEPPLVDKIMAQFGVLTHEKIGIIAGSSVAFSLIVGLVLFWCCGSRKNTDDEFRPPTPFADRATSLPTAKQRRRSYKTLEG